MAKSNVIIKQKKSETEVVDIYPQTESNIVINNSTNVTGDTVTDAFDNALPLTAGKNISINPSATGVEIAFTGSLAPNVVVQSDPDDSNNPVEVTGTPGDTSATYIVKHKTTGLSGGYDKTASTVSTISQGGSGTVIIPKITVDAYGHITAATNENVTITIPSVDGMVTTSSTLNDNKIILGNGEHTIKTSSYGISTSLTAGTNPSLYVPTVSAVKSYVDNKITNSVQYLGVGTGIDSTTGSITGMDVPNSLGDWGRITKLFTVPSSLSSSGAAETAHVGDIIICTQINTTNPLYKWDVIHTEVDTDTWRPVQVNGTSIDSSNTHNTLNLRAGTNVGLSNNNGTVTINATDTNTTYSLSHNKTSDNKDIENTVKLTPNSGAATTITINNVANATTATKVANALTVQFSGTNQFTYDGSAAKTLNITASGIGAAASSHTHGYITNDGRIGSPSDTTVTNTSKIVITDGNAYKITRSSITFDGKTTNKALTPSGQWKEFLQANQSITINSGLKHKKLETDEDVSIIGTASGTAPVLGESGIGKGIYSAIEVNKQGIAIAGSQVIKYYAWGTTDKFIKEDTNLASGGFAFVELP